MSFLVRILKYCDIYGSSVNLNILGQRRYTTSVGGILTILTFMLFCLFSYYFSVDLLAKSNPLVKYYKTDLSNSDILQLNFSNFLISYELVNYKGEHIDHDHPIFNFTASTDRRQALPSSSINYVSRNLAIENCSKTDFTEFGADYNEMILKSFKCINFESVDALGSLFSSLDAEFIRFKVKYHPENFKKLSPQDQVKLSPFMIRIFYYTYSYNPDIEEPFNKRLSYSEGFVNTAFSFKLYASFFMGMSINDVDWFFQSNRSTKMLFTIDDFKMINFPISIFPNDSLGFAEIYQIIIYLNEQKEMFFRSYKKVPDILANSAAIGKMFMYLFSTLSFLYNRNRVQDNLSFQFFKYFPEVNYDTKEILQTIKNIKGKSLIGAEGSISPKKGSTMDLFETLPKVFLSSQKRSLNKKRIRKQKLIFDSDNLNNSKTIRNYSVFSNMDDQKNRQQTRMKSSNQLKLSGANLKFQTTEFKMNDYEKTYNVPQKDKFVLH